MFDKSEVDRLRAWHNFRTNLETADDPLQDTIDLYNRAPLVSIVMDPWDQETWLDPWELLTENQYCEFSLVLAIGYTLSLTDRFKDTPKEIHICTNKEIAETKYLLYIGDKVIGYDRHTSINKDEIGAEWAAEKVYAVPTYQ